MHLIQSNSFNDDDDDDDDDDDNLYLKYEISSKLVLFQRAV